MTLAERQHTPYRMHEVVQRTGATPRQVRHWIALGLVWPSQPRPGKGSPIGFSGEDVKWVGVLKSLADLGVEPGDILEASRRVGTRVYAQRLERAARALQSHAPWWLD